MRPFWYLVFLVGLVASEDPKSNDVPGCGDLKSGSKEMNPTTPTTRTETTSTMTTEETTSSTTTTEATSPSTTTTSTTTPSTTPKKGAREADRRKYGYYRDGNQCIHKVLTSYQQVYHADCIYLCRRYPFRFSVPNGMPCLMVLENGLQERQYTNSKLCRKGQCLHGSCVPSVYVQKCSIPTNGPGIPRRDINNRYE
ncbi:uncharacterized protein [Dermacentor andersoni]|uniref:uncharacterized protein isoform X2 n=1 Tax=Dermacentor andersoni TaxID=34620 RepID=UPI002155030F|nr:uncharacterized protein LOC126529322 isoform X2 [Dermacentor andersoni]